MSLPWAKAGKKKWESDAQRKRITRQRNKLIEEIAELDINVSLKTDKSPLM